MFIKDSLSAASVSDKMQSDMHTMNEGEKVMPTFTTSTMRLWSQPVLQPLTGEESAWPSSDMS